MKKWEKCLSVLTVLLVMSATVSATIVNDSVPSWRGEENTTFQAWGFDDASNPASVELSSVNIYGAPTLNIINVFGLTDWMPDYTTSQGTAYGVWKLYAGQMEITIPNTDNTEPDTWKEILIQITYYDPGGVGGNIPLVFNPLPSATVERTGRDELDNGFFHDTYRIIIMPNPTSEDITISPIQCQLYVDEVIIDTACLPEPMTIAMLGLGGLMLRRKK